MAREIIFCVNIIMLSMSGSETSIPIEVFAAFNILTVTANREIQVDKSSEFKIKFWAFLGLKIGLRI
jgi:hypothetical protein